jgi:Carboxypeptidase regulatory-like domain/Ankyrin repeats (3 copies)/Ankyrin repeats (many copies)
VRLSFSPRLSNQFFDKETNMATRNFLRNLTVPSPCKADWNSMSGNDQVRFCEHCSLQVHNLSAMTRNQAERLVARSKGRLCVRYHHDAAGQPAPLPLFPKLHRINRRVSRIAAGAFTATISMTSAMAQGPAGADVNQPVATQLARRWAPGASVTGLIKDEQGAVISGATIFISNTELNVSLYASTGFDGQFKIENLQPGSYNVRIEAPGFAADQTDGLYVQPSGELRVDRTLQVDKVPDPVSESTEEVRYVSGGGAVAFVEPSDPFVRAAFNDDLETLESLIAGAQVDVRDRRSHTTALEHAVQNGNREMVQLLLSSGAKVNATNEEGGTVLMMLDEDVTSDLIWDLINAGADVKHKDEAGNTPLMRAAGISNIEVLKTLLDAGAEVNTKNKQGQTPLMLAALEGLVNNVRALVLAGADINAKDEDEVTALGHAMEGDHATVIRFLKSKGAVEPVAQVDKDH